MSDQRYQSAENGMRNYQDSTQLVPEDL